MFDSINEEQRLYNLRHGTGKDAGYTCLGFDVAQKWGEQVNAWLPADKRVPFDAPKGTEGHYAQYDAIMQAGAAHAAATKTRCPAQLTPQLVGLEGKRVEVTSPDGERARFYVGKSSGWMPCHLEIKTRGSSGGGAVYIPSGATVRVIDNNRR